MRIALLITSLGLGGAERLVVDLADRYASLGHAVLIIYLAGEPTLVPSNSSVRISGTGIDYSIKNIVRSFFSVRQELREFRPDVVHSHLFHANLLARVLRVTMRIPKLISSAHNTNEEGRGRMMAYRLTDWLVDISTNVSDNAVAAFISQGALKPERMITLHNGIDVNKFRFSQKARDGLREILGVSETKLALAVGRLCDAKDYANLITAFARIKAKEIDIKLAIAGSGPLKASLEALADKLGVGGDVIFLGVRHDIVELMSACDVFVLSSAREGFALVVAEAMACGRIVVATDCGGVREVVGDAGLLVSPRDPEELAFAVLRAINMPLGAATVMAGNARDRIERLYSLDVAVEKWLRLYDADLTRLRKR